MCACVWINIFIMRVHATTRFKCFNMYKRPDVVVSSTSLLPPCRYRGRGKKNTKNSENKLSNAPRAFTQLRVFFLVFSGVRTPRAGSHSIYFAETEYARMQHQLLLLFIIHRVSSHEDPINV